MDHVTVRDFIKHCSDWSAPFEVAKRIFGPDFTPQQCVRVTKGLNAMRSLKMAEFHKGNNTYKCCAPDLPRPNTRSEK
jgi:hypothetical protein